MALLNHTPFPALAFQGVDQARQAFHVVVLRQTLTWDAAGRVKFADGQAPLCEADEAFDRSNAYDVRQESDLCPYKPKADVIVNATAWPPARVGGKAPTRFEVRLKVQRPSMPGPLPRKPQSLNPYMPVDPVELAAWNKAVQRAKMQPVPGAVLIDKTLHVTGPRSFTKLNLARALTGSMLKISSLGFVPMPVDWRLTAPATAQPLALRLDQCFGGECRMEADSPMSRKVPKKHRLDQEAASNYPDGEAPPLAHAACPANPAGVGFVADWYLSATQLRKVPAPRIEDPRHRIDHRDFNKARNGQLKPERAAELVVGMGVRPKGHPERARLCGTVDQEFAKSDAPLPDDFNFAVWNAAWPDQQASELQGDETLELTNLCAPGAEGARCDAQGNTTLRLTLPGHLPFVLVRFENGAIGELPARLDTVLIEPELKQITCVWRAVCAAQPAVRTLEARMLMSTEVQALAGNTAPGQKAEALHG